MAEDQLTFGDGILLVHRPQQLQGKDRRTTSAPGNQQAAPASLGMGSQHLGALGKTAVLLPSGEGAGKQNPETSRIFELNRL